MSYAPSTLALLIIDVQRDFAEGGALAVPDGNAVVPKINALRAGLNRPHIYKSQDWHPQDHTSFYTNNAGAVPFSTVELSSGPQVMWPPHCVQGSEGAEFISGLNHGDTDSDGIILKGTNPAVDSYSAFGDATPGHSLEKTELEINLAYDGVKTVVVCGLALDYCVSYTAKDAAAAGFKTYVVLDACRGIAAESIDKEIGEMTEAGVIIVSTMLDLPAELLKPVPYME